MAKQPYYPPEVSLLLLAGINLLESLSVEFSGFTELEEHDKEWGEPESYYSPINF